jgi:NTE family protein
MTNGPAAHHTTLNADLVLSGGGVKGIGLAGAIVALMEAGYSIRRVSGTSAGSIAGSILAAGSKGDQLTPDEVKQLTMTVPYRKFLDSTPVTGIPLLGPAWSLFGENGIYKGDFAHNWVRSELGNLGVRSFGDLALDDDSLPPERRYRLVVTVADVTTGQVVRLPWDYRRLYGLDPDEQQVADAVRASMSIPFFFRVAKLTSTSGLTSTLVDGGLLSNFPLDTFDRSDGKSPRWPTFGVTVLPNLPQGNDKVIPGLAPLRCFGGPTLLENVITTMIVGHDQAHLNHPWVSARAVRVDSTDVGFLDFKISRKQMQALYQRGYQAAQTFLSTWNWTTYLDRFRRPVSEFGN